MKYDTNTGYLLLDDHLDLEVRLTQNGKAILISFIGACIESGWDSEEAILGKVQQISGPYQIDEVTQLLREHASPVARPQLWSRIENGRFKLTERGWETGELENSGHPTCPTVVIRDLRTGEIER